SPQKRTIATSRSEATTTEPEPQNETVVRTQESPPPTNPGKPDIRPALPLRSHPDGNRFRLTSSFRNGPTHRVEFVSRWSARRSHRPRGAGPERARGGFNAQVGAPPGGRRCIFSARPPAPVGSWRFDFRLRPMDGPTIRLG